MKKKKKKKRVDNVFIEFRAISSVISSALSLCLESYQQAGFVN